MCLLFGGSTVHRKWEVRYKMSKEELLIKPGILQQFHTLAPEPDPPTHHEPLDDLKIIVDDFGQGSQAVCGTGGIAVQWRENVTDELSCFSGRHKANRKFQLLQIASYSENLLP